MGSHESPKSESRAVCSAQASGQVKVDDIIEMIDGIPASKDIEQGWSLPSWYRIFCMRALERTSHMGVHARADTHIHTQNTLGSRSVLEGICRQQGGTPPEASGEATMFTVSAATPSKSVEQHTQTHAHAHNAQTHTYTQRAHTCSSRGGSSSWPRTPHALARKKMQGFLGPEIIKVQLARGAIEGTRKAEEVTPTQRDAENRKKQQEQKEGKGVPKQGPAQQTLLASMGAMLGSGGGGGGGNDRGGGETGGKPGSGVGGMFSGWAVGIGSGKGNGDGSKRSDGSFREGGASAGAAAGQPKGGARAAAAANSSPTTQQAQQATPPLGGLFAGISGALGGGGTTQAGASKVQETPSGTRAAGDLLCSRDCTRTPAPAKLL